MLRLGNSVAAGRWDDVAAVLGTLPPKQAEAVYHQIVLSLNDTAVFGKLSDTDTLSPDDVLHLADALPAAIAMPETDLAATGKLFGKTLALAGPTSAAVAELKAGAGRFGTGSPTKQAATATMLIAAGDLDWAKAYLPDVESVLKANDPALDRLFCRYALSAAAVADGTRDPVTASRMRRHRISPDASWRSPARRRDAGRSRHGISTRLSHQPVASAV
ncbi:MAG: hypothetical protein QM754_09260 [Tepidisphaeraceae bacterium]